MKNDSQDQALVFGPFRLVRRGGTLYRATQDGSRIPVVLGSRALDVLEALLARPGELVTKSEIMARVWPNTVVEEGNLTVQISALRRVLKTGGAGNDWIVTVPGRGYRFSGQVTQEIDAPRISVPLPDRPSLAVLAFTNLGGNPDQEYFSDGLAEDLTIALSRNHRFFVIAQQSSFSYKGTDTSIRVLAQELGVRYVVQGSVRRSAARMRIAVQVVDTETSTNVWVEYYDRELTDIFAVQDEITAAVAASIEPSIAAREYEHAKQKPPESLDAWEAYHRGMWHYSKSTVAENHKARELFMRATALDATFSAAYQGLALTHLDEAVLYGKRTPEDVLADAETPARMAVALDPNDAHAHVTLTFFFFIRGDLETALAEADYALSLNASSASVHWARSGVLAFMGRFQDARVAASTFLRLSPRDPRAWRVLSHLTLAAYAEGEHALAADVARRGIRANPAQPTLYRWLIAALGQLGRVEEAQVVIRDVNELLRPMTFDDYAVVRGPWWRDAVYDALLEGLCKAGWKPASAK